MWKKRLVQSHKSFGVKQIFKWLLSWLAIQVQKRYGYYELIDDYR